jgi:alpha-1,6-mannosyltransferase
MGIDQNCFSPALRDPDLRARLLARCALPREATLLLGVGRHAPEKRWPMVVRAVAAAGITHPVGLILAGDGRDRARVLRQIDGNPHIQLLSPITDRLELARLMASCDALIHGCEAETFSMVAAEAVASGLPIIVPDRGGAADHALPDKGLLYAATDAASAADAIRTFIDARAPRPAPRARTMARHFDELFALYEACAEGRAAA